MVGYPFLPPGWIRIGSQVGIPLEAGIQGAPGLGLGQQHLYAANNVLKLSSSTLHIQR